MRTVRLIVLLLVVVSLGFAQAPPADLDAWVTRAMKEFEVPGAAVAIVKDGKVVLAKGYGVRRLGDPAKVDENTLFGIASNTKAFAATTAAMLVDEGKLSWDDPVAKHLPHFAVADPYVSREVTVRDILSHRTGMGLGAGDLLFWPDTNITRRQVVERARHIPMDSSFRSRYEYNNLGFVVAGEVVATLSGKSWNDVVRDRIFTPLGMTATGVSTAPRDGANFASPHSRGWRLQGGTLEPVPITKDETWAAAAGIRSNVVDLAKWVIANLNGGKTADGKQLWSERSTREMWSMHIPIGVRPPRIDALKQATPNFAGYGLGWSLRDYRGHKMIGHGGALVGMLSTVQMLPSQNLGVIVLTNYEESGIFNSIVYRIFDHYLKVPAQTDWIAAFRHQRDETLKRSAEEEAKLNAARENSRPSLELSRYVGDYEDPWYGKASLRQDGGKLVWSMEHSPTLTGDVEHWQHNTFRVVFRDKTVPDAFLTFNLNPDGTIAELKMVPMLEIADFSFDYQDLMFKPVKKAEAKTQ